MRGFTLRLLASGMLMALLTWGVSGQKIKPVAPPAGTPGSKDKDKDKDKDDPSIDDNWPFVVPRDRAHKKRLEAVPQYLDYKDPANIKWNDVCNFLQAILDSKSDSFYNVKFKGADGKWQITPTSVKTEANRLISTFSSEGVQFYQQLHGQKASDLLDDAIKANYDLATLSDLSQRYLNTKAGAQGTILLATIQLERGNYLEAAYAFERLMPRKDIDDLFTPLTLFKATLAFKRSGEKRHEDLLKSTMEKLEKAAAKDGGIAISGRKYTMEMARKELDRPVELLRRSDLVGEWPMRGGSASRTAFVEGGPPFLDPVFRSPMFHFSPEGEEPNTWIKTELDKLFSFDSKMVARGSVLLPGAFPVTTTDLLIYRDYEGVTAVSTRDTIEGGRVVRAGEVRWRSRTTAGLHQLQQTGPGSDVDMRNYTQNWWTTFSNRNTGVSSILYENPLIGSPSHDGQYVYFIDDVAITPPPVYNAPEFGIVGGQQFPQSGKLSEFVRAGRLAAVDLKTGVLKWELGRFNGSTKAPEPLNEEDADTTNDVFRLCLDAIFLGAPMPLNGKLYVLIEQNSVVRLLCLDPKQLVKAPGPDPTPKPALLWSQKLGKPIQAHKLPEDSVRRYQGANLATGEGILICPTNCGVVVAVDIMSHSLLWAYGYRDLAENTTDPRRGRGIDPNTGLPFAAQQPQLKSERWHAGGPIISNGRVIVTAYDSPKLSCLDLRSGKELWAVTHDPNDLYVGGVVNDRVIVVGKNYVKAYHLTGETGQAPKLAWQQNAVPTPTGHGALSRESFYLPVRQEAAGRDPATPAGEIWAFKITDGTVTSKTAARKRTDTTELTKYGIGNLVFQDGMVYSQSPWEVACYPQLGAKIAEMDKLLKKNPNDPIGLLTRGELALDNGELKKAVADFKAAEKNGLPEEKKPLVREKLYIAYTELLRADFNSAEDFLKEYETLCETPANANETPEEQSRREDDTKRRKRQYRYLLARGRESQGRLGEAFDHYLALANLGEGKQLLEMPDEPNVKMRPDVWARGRIEAMIRRAATAEAKKSLEDRVHKEWLTVKDANDLPKLREFVAIFGPFFDDGREAQFKLAEVLLSTKNEADSREAQTYLSQLRVSAEDPVVRARATEALAKLMIDNRMMEDAVGLYLQLGKEYPKVVVRDGKTGADFLNSLLTDKRLLPFLEPSRFPLPGRVTAKQELATTGVNAGAQFEIESPPDLFPAFRQYRFVLDQYRSGGNGWMLIGYDRSTGNERIRIPGMGVPNLYSNNGPIPYSKFVQGYGHIMVIQLGTMVYCFDLAEKKEIWNVNLLGDSGPPVQPGGFVQNPQVEISPDGTCIVRYVDGYVLTLGRSTIVQPGYVAILTRDGLECREPLSKRTLWMRTGIADRTQIHGDGRYIVLLETDVGQTMRYPPVNPKPVSAKLIRAVDGLIVEGSPDSGKVLADATSYRIYGRHALLTSGTGDQPRVLRLYDLATGKDVWKKEFDAKSVPITSPLNNDWTGFITPDGTAEVFSVRTGESVAKMKIDEKNLEAHLKPCVGAQVFADNDRFYLTLDRDFTAASPNGINPGHVINYTVRSQKVNGPIYAFDRGTSKRLWFYADLLDHQSLIIEQFADLPVIMVASPVIQNNVYIHPVVVIEKERGKVVYNKTVPYNGSPFQQLSVDYKNGTVSLNRYDARIYITPEEEKPKK